MEERRSITNAESVERSLRPALIVGLGGTGHRIAVHAKAAFLRALGEVPAHRVRILAFDTVDESPSALANGQTVTLEPDREFFCIGHTPVASIMRNLQHQPAIAARLPGLHALPPVVLRAGAKQVRPLGLLSLLWHFNDVERRLRTAIWELASKDTLGRQSGQAQGINVFICFSVVGGTGSGTFLDVAYLVRSLFHEMGSLGDFCYTTGIAVLPQAFRGIEGPNLIPNTVAAFQELSQCMLRGGRGNGGNMLYPNGRSLETNDPPFNLLYLLDGVDEQGYVWGSLNELCDMAATGIYLQIGSQVGRKGENDFDNLDEVLGNQTDDGEGTFCGSFGMAMLRFDSPRVAEWCASRLARRMIAEGLIAPTDPVEARTQAESWLRTQMPSSESILESLARDESGVPLAIDVRPPEWISRGRDARVSQEAVRYIRDYERVRLHGEFKALAEANRQALERSLRQGLDEALSAMLSNAIHGVSEGLALCRALDTLLETQEKALDGPRTAAAMDRARLEEELAARETALQHAASANLLVRSRAIGEARDRYLQVADMCFTRAWQEMLAQERMAVLASLRSDVAEWTRQLDALRSHLGVAVSSLDDQARILLKSPLETQHAGVIDLADPAYCDRLYAAHEPPWEQILVQLIEHSPPHTWLSPDSDRIVEQVLAAARRSFSALADLTIEQVIAERASEASPAARRERLLRLATPSWNLDLTRLQDGRSGLRSVQVLGVADEGHSVFEDARLLVSTHDPTTVTAFLASVGAPLSAIQQYPAYLRRYEAVRRVRMLHVLPQFQADHDQSKLAFALGTIFGLIYARGTYFYYRPADPLDAPVRLDQGLENAILRFARADCPGVSTSLAQDALERIERQIEEIGTAAAVERLSAYYAQVPEEDRGNGDGTLAGLHKLVRRYADELRATLQATNGGQMR